jgi:hypothetical protein
VTHVHPPEGGGKSAPVLSRNAVTVLGGVRHNINAAPYISSVILSISTHKFTKHYLYYDVIDAPSILRS